MATVGPQNPVLNQYRQLLARSGNVALAQLYPNDFEAYMCSFELVDSRDRVCEFFCFPVMPSSMRQTNSSLLNVKKTMGGVTVLSTHTFVPMDMELTGNFGRRFKFLVGQDLVDASALSFSTFGGVFTKNEALKEGALAVRNTLYSSQIKTGYGCFKILEAICNKSTGLDEDGNPYHLYFYNPALNEHYLTEIISFVSSQDKDSSNMIWQYNLQMKFVAPIDGLKRDGSKDSLTKTLQYGLINQGINLGLSNLIASRKSAQGGFEL